MISKNKQTKVLVIEDEIPIQDIYRMKLTSSGYDVRTASNGVAGLIQAKTFMPDLILLDLRMPDMAGDEMLQKLRAEDWGKDIKVIIMTNISKDEAPRTLASLDVSHYLMKVMFTPQQVADMVAKTLAEK